MPTKLSQIEERLRRVEAELAELKQSKQREDSVPWYRRAAGQFKDDPVFDEIVRLGKEIRDAEKTPDLILPDRRKRSTRRKGS